MMLESIEATEIFGHFSAFKSVILVYLKKWKWLYLDRLLPFYTEIQSENIT